MVVEVGSGSATSAAAAGAADGPCPGDPAAHTNRNNTRRQKGVASRPRRLRHYRCRLCRRGGSGGGCGGGCDGGCDGSCDGRCHRGERDGVRGHRRGDHGLAQAVHALEVDLKRTQVDTCMVQFFEKIFTSNY